MKLNSNSRPSRDATFSSRRRRLDPHYRDALGWMAVALAAILALVLGIVGFHKNLAVTDPEHDYSLATLTFMALQMLVLNTGANSEPIGWELQTARFFAVLVFSATVLKTLLAIFHKPMESLSVRFVLKGHVVIVGADQKGTRLAGDMLAVGETVVMVEREIEHGKLEALRELGAYVVAGDAVLPQTLENAGVSRAGRILVACGDDTTNIEIAAAADELCRRDRSASLAVLPIHVHCADRRLFNFLESGTKGGLAGSRVEFHRFDVVLNGARLLLQEHPLDRMPIAADSTTVVQLVLLGWTRESECLLLHTARLGHFANLLRPRIIVVDPQASTHERRLRFRFPQIDHVCRLTFVSRDLHDRGTMADVERWIDDETAITTLIISPVDENNVLPLALELPLCVADRNVPVFVRLSSRDRLAGLLENEHHRLRLIPFGSLAHVSDANTVIHADLDRIAKAIHEAYVRKRTQEGDSPARFSRMRPWNELAESDKEANRDQADHLAVKLRAVNCLMVPQDELHGREPAIWTEHEIETLAKMEHDRWSANRWLDGWQKGPRDDLRKLHDCLVPWEELDERTRDFDRDPVRNIPQLLKLAGWAIVRRN